MNPEDVPAELVEKAAQAVLGLFEVCAMDDTEEPNAACVYCQDDAKGYALAALAAVLDRPFPDVFGGCVCSFESEDRGGGYSELVQEYEPACPVHSEHVYDPIQGMWIVRTEVPAKPERPVDPWSEVVPPFTD